MHPAFSPGGALPNPVHLPDHGRPRLEPLWENALEPPDDVLPVLCVYVNDTKTALTVFKQDLSDVAATVDSYTGGDGTVNLPSLRICGKWRTSTVVERTLGGSISAHNDILSDEETIRTIHRWVTRNSTLA